jgi:hypothetical protein
MLEYRIIKLNNSALPELWKDSWIMCWINNEFMYFYREVKRIRSEKNFLVTPEYSEFKIKYPSNTWIYDEKFIIKYNKLVSEWLHEQIIKSVEQYKKELEVTKKPVANPSTYINQKRYLQDFKVVKCKNEEWQNELLKELPSKIIEQILSKKKDWEDTNKKDISEGVFKNIIDYYLTK